MTSSAPNFSAESESELLELLRSKYTGQGYQFLAHPPKNALPSFFEGYEPDAVAFGPSGNIAFEIKYKPSSAGGRSLKDIQRLFEHQPDWALIVSHIGRDPLKQITIPVASREALRNQVRSVQSLANRGELRAAFVMAWALLEAAAHHVTTNKNGRPLTPGSVVQSLAMNGFVGPDVERELRNLIVLRNRVVHGDLTAEPTEHDVRRVIRAAEATLSDHTLSDPF